MTACSVDRCPLISHARGLCRTHYQRFSVYGDPMAHVPIGHAGWSLRFDPDAVVCGCVVPLDPSPIGECSRCRRVVESMLDPGPRRAPMDVLVARSGAESGG